MKISVIVPVYNTAPYLEKCVMSILQQTFTDYELILIDDGSTDNSLEVCKKLEVRDERITVLTKKNGGLADTRNFGLKYASGEYICFLDSDDWFENDMLNQYIVSLERCKYECDVVIQGFCVDFEKENLTFRKAFEREKKFLKSEIWKGILLAEEQGLFNSSCNKLYRRDVILNHSIEYDIGSEPAEDLIFNCKFFPEVKGIICIAYAGYHYIKREIQTLTVKYMPEYEKKIMIFHEARKKLYERIAMPEDRKNEWLSSSLASYTLTAVSNLYRKNTELNFASRSKKLSFLMNQYEITKALQTSEYCDAYIKIIKIAFNLPNSVFSNIFLSLMYGGRYRFGELYKSIRRRILYSKEI